MSSFLPGKKNTDNQVLNKAFKNELPPRRHSWVFLLFILLISTLFFTFLYNPPKPPMEQQAIAEQKHHDYLEQYRLQQQRLQDELDKLDPFANPSAAGEELPEDIAPGYHRVAAAQFFSEFGESQKNLERMKLFIETAAEKKVELIVFPEAAVCGYADLNDWNLWAADPKAAALVDKAPTFHAVANAAERSTGPAFKSISNLAAKHHMIIAYGYIEKSEDGKYFSSLQLISAKGEPLANYRKKRLWEKADPFWATASMLPQWKTADTELGKIGLIISYDFKPGIKELGKEKVDYILHSCAFYGDNLLNYFAKGEYVDLVKESGAAVIMANWANRYVADWGGYGLSRVLAPGGMILAARGATPGEFLVVNDLPMHRAKRNSMAANKKNGYHTASIRAP